MDEVVEKLTTEHELYISVGLHNPMKPTVFRDLIDDLLFEHIGYMQSWGVHTNTDYIEIIDRQQETIKQLTEAIQSAHSSLTWSNTENQIPHAIWHLEKVLPKASETNESA